MHLRKTILSLLLAMLLCSPFPIQAKKSYHWTKKEEKLIQKIMYLEARGHGVKGMTLVGRTIMNRVQSKKFPNTVTKVIYAKGQFSTIKYLKRGKITKKTKKALSNVKKGKYKKMKALYFCNKQAYKGWWHTLAVCYHYKSHIYAK